MAVGIGSLGNIVEDFKESVSQIFGNSAGKEPSGKGLESVLFDAELGGSHSLDRSKWTGNAIKPNAVRYGFIILNQSQIAGGQNISLDSQNFGTANAYFLSIPPQSISQKEIFSNNIVATRKGVIVETEGVVFKDIIIQGTTGVFPAKRGEANNPIPNFKNITSPPKSPQGVDANNGRSTNSTVSAISGYEEFLRLRQFFLYYANEKVKTQGNRFLIFINEKDNQNLIVEPLEFTMERNAKSPMTYDYRIALKAIGNLDDILVNALTKSSQATGFLGLLEDVGNVAANVGATVAAARATINQSTRLLQRVSQAIDQTFIGPLRQIQFALQDLNDGIATALSLPSILMNNATSTVLNIRDSIDDLGNAFDNFSLSRRGSKQGFNQSSYQLNQIVRGNNITGNQQLSSRSINTNIGQATTSRQVTTNSGASVSVETSSSNISKQSTSAEEQQRINEKQLAEDFSIVRTIIDRINNDARVPIPRSFVESVRDEAAKLSLSLTDSFNLDSEEYSNIINHTKTNVASPLKIVSDDEFILLGAINNIVVGLNTLLATNALFESDPEIAFRQTEVRTNNILSLPVPVKVKEAKILRNDSLERIAQRELNDASRWVELVVINNLKPPYISDTITADGVRKPGDGILIPSV